VPLSRRCLLAGLVTSATAAYAAPARAAPRELGVPARAKDAESASALAEGWADLPHEKIEAAMVEQVLAGNVPDRLRTLEPVDVSQRGGAKITLWVSRDYLAVGDDHDFMTLRLTGPDAEALAQKLGGWLPTPHIVNGIYRTGCKLVSPGLGEKPHVQWFDQARRYDALVEKRQNDGAGTLHAGHFKDIVATPALMRHPGRLAIYGLHDSSGTPTQPISLFHRDVYVDYIQGTRLVSNEVELDGEPLTLVELLADHPEGRHLCSGARLELPVYS